jgi:Glycosyl transferase family 2
MVGNSRDTLDTLVKFVADNGVSATELQKIAPALTRRWPQRAKVDDPTEPSAPATVAGTCISYTGTKEDARRLTIGMATYDDYDGVYFTLQAIRLYHPEILDKVEFLIVDNNPDGPSGPALRELGNWARNYRYIAKGEVAGTAAREWVFREARTEFVLCIDCHVLIANGALKRLIDYFEANPNTRDLLQGPLLYDDLNNYSTHFAPRWQAGMYGVWDTNPAGADADQPPFEIPMQGLGLFACRRGIWPGFNPGFRGFGGEEGYIHEKFRRRGGKVLCLPFLRWMHRFGRPSGLSYTNRWEDRVRNYLIGFRELGWDTAPIVEHFRTMLGEALWSLIAVRLGEDALLSDDQPGGSCLATAITVEPSGMQWATKSRVRSPTGAAAGGANCD